MSLVYPFQNLMKRVVCSPSHTTPSHEQESVKILDKSRRYSLRKKGVILHVYTRAQPIPRRCCGERNQLKRVSFFRNRVVDEGMDVIIWSGRDRWCIVLARVCRCRFPLNVQEHGIGQKAPAWWVVCERGPYGVAFMCLCDLGLYQGELIVLHATMLRH